MYTLAEVVFEPEPVKNFVKNVGSIEEGENYLYDTYGRDIVSIAHDDDHDAADIMVLKDLTSILQFSIERSA